MIDTDFLSAISKSIKDARDNVSKADKTLDDVYNSQQNLEKVIEKLQNALSELSSDLVIRKSIEDIFEFIKIQKSSLLVSRIGEALLSSSEFDDPVFAPYLIQAASKPDSLLMFLNYSGLGSTITVDNNLNEVAGSLEDWGRAVSAVRGKTRTDPEQASSSWANLFSSKSNNSLWNNIQQERAIFSGKLAPFWEILDKGHANIHLSSDRGGYATPTEAPTHFVSDTIDDLEELFKKQILSLEKSLLRAKEKLIKKSELAKTLLLELNDISEFIDENSDRIVGEISDESVPVNTIISSIEERLKKTQAYIDTSKLKTIVEELLETGTVSSYKITSAGRIEVTASGSTSRARVSINVLLEMIAQG